MLLVILGLHYSVPRNLSVCVLQKAHQIIIDIERLLFAAI